MTPSLSRRLGLSALALVLCTALASCGSSNPGTVNPKRATSSQDNNAVQESVSTEEPDANTDNDSPQEIGTSAADTFCVTLYNGLPGNVVSLRIRSSSSTGYGDNVLAQGSIIQENEVVRINVPLGTNNEIQTYDAMVVLSTPDGDQEFELIKALKNGQSYVALRQNDGTAYATDDTEDGADAGAGNVILRD